MEGRIKPTLSLFPLQSLLVTYPVHIVSKGVIIAQRLPGGDFSSCGIQVEVLQGNLGFRGKVLNLVGCVLEIYTRN